MTALFRKLWWDGNGLRKTRYYRRNINSKGQIGKFSLIHNYRKTTNISSPLNLTDFEEGSWVAIVQSLGPKKIKF
jgi:hypothetical protein